MSWAPTDPEGTFWRRGLRLAIVLPIVLAAALEYGPEQSVVYAVFSVVACLSLADFGGPPWRRLGAYAALASFGLVNIVIGSLSSRSVLAGVLAAFGVGLLARLLAVFGGYWGMGTFSALLAFVLSVTTEMPAGGLPDRLGGWAVGCATAAVAALTLWPRRERLDYRRLVATAAGSVAASLRVQLPGEHSVTHRSAAERSTAAVDSAREWLLTTPYRPAGPAAGDRALVELTMLLGRCEHAASELGGTDGDPVDVAPVVGSTADLLDQAGERLLDDAGPLVAAAARVQAERDALQHRVERWVARSPGAPSADTGGNDVRAAEEDAERRVLDRAFRALTCARLAEELAWCVEFTVGGRAPEIAAMIGRAPEARRWSGTALRILRSHLTLRSAWLRQCVRTGAGLALAVGIAMVTRIDHGFWVVLGTLSVLRTSARATTTTALRAVVGTVIGFLAATVAISATGGSNTALWVLLPLVSFAGVYLAGVVDDIWGQAGFTLMVVMIFDLIAPGGWEVGLVRVQTVAIGACVSMVVGVLLWPRGVGLVVRNDVADYFRSTGGLLAAVVGVFARAQDASALRPLDRQAADDHQRAVQAYSEYLGESPTHLQRWGIWARVLFVPSYTSFAARHLEQTLGTHTAPSPQVATALAAHGSSLGERMAAIGDRIAPTTARHHGTAPHPSTAPHQVTVHDGTAPATEPAGSAGAGNASAALDDALRSAGGSEELARRVVAQVWVDCWLRDLDEVLAGLDAPLALLEQPAPDRRTTPADSSLQS